MRLLRCTIELTSLSAPDGRIATELELVVVAIDGKGGKPRPLSDQERATLSA